MADVPPERPPPVQPNIWKCLVSRTRHFLSTSFECAELAQTRVYGNDTPLSTLTLAEFSPSCVELIGPLHQPKHARRRLTPSRGRQAVSNPCRRDLLGLSNYSRAPCPWAKSSPSSRTMPVAACSQA